MNMMATSSPKAQPYSLISGLRNPFKMLPSVSDFYQPNVCRAIARNPKVYPEPGSFIPDRWLPVEGKEPPLDINKVAFGFGRR